MQQDEALAEKALTVEHVFEIAIQGAIIVSDPEAPAVTLEMRQLLNQLAPVLLGGTRAPTLVSESTSVTTVETGSGSFLPAPTPPMDILKELTLQMIEQFFTMMKYCTELILNRRSSSSSHEHSSRTKLRISARLGVLIERKRSKCW